MFRGNEYESIINDKNNEEMLQISNKALQCASKSVN